MAKTLNSSMPKSGQRILTTRLPWRSLLVLGSGVMMALAAPPYGLWPLAWVALAPLATLILTVRPSWRLAFGWGLLWGVGFHGTVLAWITHLHPLTWMGMSWTSSVAIAAFAWSAVTGWGAFTVGFWALGLNWLRRLSLNPSARAAIAAVLWCLLEFLRSLTPLDWSALALTQSPGNLWILQLSQLSGQTLVAGVLVAVNGLLAEAAASYLQRRRWAAPPAAAALLWLLLSHGLGALLWAQPLAENPAGAMQVGLVQGNVPTQIKLTPDGVRRALNGYLQGYQALVEQGVDAVLTPEGAIPAIWGTDLALTTPLIEAVKAAKVPLWLGTFAPNLAQPQVQQLQQSLLEIDASGEATAQYSKIRLVPLGEYLPLQSLLGRWIGRLSPLESYLSAGSPDQQFVTRLGPAAVGICYESAYSQLFRAQTRRGGEFIITASNNDPYPPWMMVQHHALDVIRAIESDRWAIRATNTGLSGVVSPRGKTLWLGPSNTYMVHRAALYRRQTLTPYVRWGNWLLPLGLSLSAGLLWHHRTSSRSSPID